MQDSGIGLRIGNVNVNHTYCADDVALLSENIGDAQVMINMALNFANHEGYELQPKKSVVLKIKGKNQEDESAESLSMGNTVMPEVEKATHLGVIRTTSMRCNIQANVDENISKARRSA